MSSSLDFLSALFASDVSVAIPLENAETGHRVQTVDPTFIEELAASGDALRTCALTDAGVMFLFGVAPDAQRDDYLTCTVPPTAAAIKDGTMLLVWALEHPADPGDAKPIADALGMEGLDEYIPVPPTGGWEIVHLDAEVFTTLDDLAKAYCDPKVAAPAADTYGDAVVHTPYIETEYGQEITITLGAKRESKNWKPATMPVGAFIAKLCRHVEGSKDGPAFVLADMVPGQRLKTAVKSLTGVGLDIDTGTPSSVVDAALKSLGCVTVRYTTHSHNKTHTEIKKDRFQKFAPDTEIDEDLVRRFLTEEEHWDASIVETVEYIGTDHTEKGIVVAISHRVMPKHRVVVPFKEPFMIANQGTTQLLAMKYWAKVPTALAALLKVPLDASCTDPSRLFYFPRHDAGHAFEIALFGGPYFDWQTLELDDPYEKLVEEAGKTGGKSVTEAGKKLGRWSMKRAHGFQIADVVNDLASERVRGNASQGFDIECPFDENHGNAGDTDDRACFVVNGGEGQSGIFTISCRHEGCRDKTNLDMLGKMLEDEWFPKSVLEDESYNALDPEDAPNPEAAVRITKEDKASTVYEQAVDTLHLGTSDEELHTVLETVMDANLDTRARERINKVIAKQLGSSVVTVRNMIKAIDRGRSRKNVGKARNERGRLVFGYDGSYDFDDSFDICVKALQEENQRIERPTFCCMQTTPVRLIMENIGGQQKAKFDVITNITLWSELCTLVSFVQRTEKGDGVNQKVPEDVAKHVFEQSYRKLRQAPEVIYTPLFLSDGKLVIEPKYHYDEENPDYLNILMVDNGLVVPEVPLNPTVAQMEESLNWLRTELLSDFPFLDYDGEGCERREPSEANALAMMITPFMRRMLSGRTPVFFVDKPQPGTGGTLLGQMPMWLFDGVAGSPTRYSQNEEEMQKGLIAAVQEVRSHLFFDDVKDFNNRELLRAITSHNISGRLLGSSKNVSVPNRYNWIGTGNNTVIFDEMRRRLVFIRLNAKMPKVDARKFRHPDTSGLDYEEFVQINRGQAIGHILMLIQYWISTGMEPFELRRRAGFEDWSRKVGGVLKVCGIEGFLDNLSSIDQDMDEAASKEFVREFYKKFGVANLQKPADLFNWSNDQEFDILEGNNDDQKKARFMKRLPALNGRTFTIDNANYMLKRDYDKEENVAYNLVRIEHATVEAQEAAVA